MSHNCDCFKITYYVFLKISVLTLKIRTFNYKIMEGVAYFFQKIFLAQNNTHAGTWEIFHGEAGGNDDQIITFTFICL